MAAGKDDGPLTEKDFEDMQDRLRQLDQAEETIRRAQTAGLDFTEQQKQVRELRAQITKIRNSFFPGRG